MSVLIRNLTDDELVKLDGVCRAEVQAEVDAAKNRIAARMRYDDLPSEHAGLIADAVTEARANGRLKWLTCRIDRCHLCGWAGEYPRYKKGPREGQIRDNARRSTTGGVELAGRFVRIQGHVLLGGCTECMDSLKDRLAEALRGVEAQVPETLRTDGEPKRVKYDKRRCLTCGWEGHEGEMGRLRTLMGDGSYPGKCPSCATEQIPLGRRVFEHVDGFVVVEKEKAQ